MRKYILALFATFSTFFGIRANNNQPLTLMNGEKYQIVHVEGTVKDKQSQKELQRESTFDDLKDLAFSKDVDLIVMDEEGQNFRLKLNETDSTYALQPLPTKIGLRPGKILNYLAFQQFLEGRELVVLGDSLHLEIGKEAFPLDDHHFFYIEYQWKGDSIPKKLAHQGNTILIEKTALFKVDGKPIDPEETSHFSFHYYNQKTQESLLINDFQLIFPDEEQLLSELQLLQKRYATNGKTKAEQYELFEQYIIAVYGVPQKENLMDWLNSFIKK